MTRHSCTVIIEGTSPVRTRELLKPPEALDRAVQEGDLGHRPCPARSLDRTSERSGQQRVVAGVGA